MLKFWCISKIFYVVTFLLWNSVGLDPDDSVNCASPVISVIIIGSTWMAVIVGILIIISIRIHTREVTIKQLKIYMMFGSLEIASYMCFCMIFQIGHYYHRNCLSGGLYEKGKNPRYALLSLAVGMQILQIIPAVLLCWSKIHESSFRDAWSRLIG